MRLGPGRPVGEVRGMATRYGVRRGILVLQVLLSGACAGKHQDQAQNDATPDGTMLTDAAAPDDITPTKDAATTPDDTGADASNDRVASIDASSGDSVTAVGKQTLYYLDVQGRVMSVDVQSGTAGTPRTVVASAGQGPDGIAIDKAHGYLYWTTMGTPSANDGTVMRAKLDGSAVTTLVPKGDTFTPKQLKLDLAGGKLYWSDREGMRVQRANLDGTELETLVTVATGDTARMDSANWCVGIALDLPGGWLYWTQKGPDNGRVGSIRRARIDLPSGQTSANRSDIEVLWSGLPEPIDLDVDVEGGFLYWTDRGDDTVNRAPIAVPSGATAGSRTDRQVLVREVREAIGVVLDPPHGVLYYTSATGQLGRVNLDGTAPVSLLTKAGALTGIVVVDGN